MAGSLSTHADCNQPFLAFSCLFLPFLAFSCPLVLAFLGLFSSNPNSVISAPGVHTVRGFNGVLLGLQLFQIESGRGTRNPRTGDRFNYPLRWFHFNECCLLLPALPAYLNSPLFQSSHFCISIFSCAFLLLRFL